MRTVHFGMSVALAVNVTLGGSVAYAGEGKSAAPLVQAESATRDEHLNRILIRLISAAEIGPDGKVIFAHQLGDPRFLEPSSGVYWQISGEGHEDFSSRSLWGRKLRASGRKAWAGPLYYNSDQFPNEPLRVVERTVRLPGSDVEWQFVVAGVRDELD